MAVLTGPGSHMTKLLALPKVDNRGRKRGSANENKGGTSAQTETPDATKSTDEEQKDKGSPPSKIAATQAQMAQNVLSIVHNVPVSATFDIITALVVKYREAKTDDEGAKRDLLKLADTLQGALKAYHESREQADEQAEIEASRPKKGAKKAA
jgi:hypothetical protein